MLLQVQYLTLYYLEQYSFSITETKVQDEELISEISALKIFLNYLN